jgi:hypothetical protein
MINNGGLPPAPTPGSTMPFNGIYRAGSSELICWLTADCVTLLICAALVKLSVSAKSQNTLRLSICMGNFHN